MVTEQEKIIQFVKQQNELNRQKLVKPFAEKLVEEINHSFHVETEEKQEKPNPKFRVQPLYLRHCNEVNSSREKDNLALSF